MKGSRQFQAIISGAARTERYDEITLQMKLGSLEEILEIFGGPSAFMNNKNYNVSIWTETPFDADGRPKGLFCMKLAELQK